MGPTNTFNGSGNMMASSGSGFPTGNGMPDQSMGMPNLVSRFSSPPPSGVMGEDNVATTGYEMALAKKPRIETSFQNSSLSTAPFDVDVEKFLLTFNIGTEAAAQ